MSDRPDVEATMRGFPDLRLKIDASLGDQYAAAFPDRLTVGFTGDGGYTLNFGRLNETFRRAFERLGFDLAPRSDGTTESRHAETEAEVRRFYAGRDETAAGYALSGALESVMQDDLAARERSRHASEHEALDVQARLVEFWGGNDGPALAAGFIDAHNRSNVPDRLLPETGLQFAQEMEESLSRATTWYVSAEMRDLATWAAASLPADLILTRDLPVGPDGFMLIEGGLVTGSDRDNGRTVLRAFQWAEADLLDADSMKPLGHGTSIQWYEDRADPRSRLYTRTIPNGWGHLPREVLLHSTGFTPGDALAAWDADVQKFVNDDLVDVDPGVEDAPTNPWRWLIAFWLLVEQPLVARRTAHASRGTQRRAERAGVVPPEPGTVRVVTMRQVRPADGQTVMSETTARRSYSHRFYVRAHWRRYHTKNGVEWKFVAGHIKGPADKPFVAKNIVYEWSR